MKTGETAAAIRDLQMLLDFGTITGLPDGQLLERFLASRDGAAFEALVVRHGPMVWGVCLRALGNHHDAQDAFQATFLVLARRAGAVVPRDMVANWLFGVACRTALKAKGTRARRQMRERTVTEMPDPGATPRPPDDRLPLLDLELARLPQKYRIPIVLCDLEGATQEDAARRVGCPVGTLSGRLWRARAMLAERLTRRGLSLSVGALAIQRAGDASGATMPAALVRSSATAAVEFSIKRAASGLVTAGVASLAEGVLKAMLLSKLKVVALAVLAVACLSGGLFVSSLPARERGSVRHAEKSPEIQPAARAEDALRGRWQATRFMIDGKPDPAEAVEKTELLIDDTSYSFAQLPPYGPRGLGSGVGRVRVDTSKVPHEIDLTPTSGVYKGLTQRGIFQVDGDTLKLCYGMPTKARPAEFATRPNSGTYLAEFRRVTAQTSPHRDDRSAKKAQGDLPEGDRDPKIKPPGLGSSGLTQR
ncbi:MAG: sigE 19 [Planctomycetota bacterium]|nr:sigE 19 [Planctomycetota bacterium]